MNADEKRSGLAHRVRARELTIAPGVFDMISARLADRVGFHALYMTGYGIAASHLGLPDAGLVSYSDMVERARTIAAGTKTALIADADTGFGGLLNVGHTVRGYEEAGVAAIQIEDQEFPKKCGHTGARRVIPLRDMLKKVEVALEARRHDDFLVIARTDARTTMGIEEAIVRGIAFAAAGADVVFIESPESEDEFRRIADTVDAPLLANMVEGGYSPMVSREGLRDLGFAIAIYPGTGFMSVAALLGSVYSHLQEHGTSLGLDCDIISADEMHALMGFEEVWEFDKRWANDEEHP